MKQEPAEATQAPAAHAPRESPSITNPTKAQGRCHAAGEKRAANAAMGI
jgi:hypothetical protein